MRYIIKTIAIILVIEIFVSPFSIRAEDNADSVAVSPPVAALAAAITFPHPGSIYNVGDETTFTAAATGGEPPYAYTWDFGDGTTAFGQSYDKTYATAGVKTVTLKITDFAGRTATASITVTIVGPAVIPPLAASIVAPANNSNVETGQTVTFTAAATGGEPPYAYTWDFGDGAEAFGQSYQKTYTEPGAKTVVLTITDFAARTATANINLTIIAPPPPSPPGEPLTISNIRVTDVTHESAIIRWMTNRAASSRVIYDTVSHPSITGQSAPNFGYAFSTAILDTDPKVVEHAVAVSSLSPNTTYYFRVISQ